MVLNYISNINHIYNDSVIKPDTNTQHKFS